MRLDNSELPQERGSRPPRREVQVVALQGVVDDAEPGQAARPDASAASTTSCARRLRRFHTWPRTRRVAWTGRGPSSSGRPWCVTPAASPEGLRPAFARRPPCVRGGGGRSGVERSRAAS